jgi:nitroreductase
MDKQEVKMDVIQAIYERYSARDFKSDPVPKDILVKIMEAALRSPSAGNGQPWQIFVSAGAVTEKITKAYLDRFNQDMPGKPEMSGLPPNQMPQWYQDRMKKITGDRQKLLGINPQDPASMKSYREFGGRLFRAPVIVILCMDKVLSTWSAFDFGLVAQTIMLAARNYGVDSIVAQSFVSYPDILRQELGISEDLKIVTGIGLGYQNSQSIINTYRSPRRSVQESVIFKGI